uniref:Small ribosomal subunit protein uS9c n=1 Tax=Nannochloropsis gaditana TaxID=72520 RepID=A0A023PLK7_9STRA|nr:30S ribosomal protein S9 [Nannochloropsis gaditana]
MVKFEKNNVVASGVGRRKSASALVKILPGTGEITVNQKPGIEYFHVIAHGLGICRTPLEIFQSDKAYNIIIEVSGGGLQGQTQAIRLAVAKAISSLDNDKRTKLRHLGLLSRDTRIKERKKCGLKKARKAPQYSKR